MKRGPSDPYRFAREELHPSVAEKVIDTSVFEYQNTKYEYGILNPDVAPVHFVVGMPNGQNLIASSAIPPELLPFYLEHEIQCNRLLADQVGRCANIEQTMIATATPEILGAFLAARRQTFEDLVRLYEIDVKNPKNAFHGEIARTTLLLRSKMQQLDV